MELISLITIYCRSGGDMPLSNLPYIADKLVAMFGDYLVNLS
jgi:hypothetical protein